MAYDHELAARIRGLIADEPHLTEQAMFGGLAFLVAGNMAVAASGQGGVLVRTDPNAPDDLAAAPDVEPMVMQGRPMRGWLHVGPRAVASQQDLARWVTTGVSYARSLPAKRR
jgi:TfoX N-terminal domain